MEKRKDETKKPEKDISCKRAAELLSESFEHELSLPKKIALKTHLAVCRTCVYCYRQLKGLRAIFRGYDKAVTELPPPSCSCLSDGAKKRIKHTLNEQSSCRKGS